ncbi:MAG: glycogen synthase [Oscillospiraceae bacterium]|jgi:starch synthase|nr:glycogen synthase [Oscillospiraceae bacterium]
MEKKKVLFATSEAAPFVTSGGLGQVAGALAATLRENFEDLDVRIVLPLYAPVRRRYFTDMKLVAETKTKLSWRDNYCGIYETQYDGIIYYFVDNLQYFGRDRAYGYYDDGERFAWFCKAVFSVIEETGFVPDVIHAHDWQTALVPIYLKTRFNNLYPDMRSVFTIHNIEYQGQFARETLYDVFDLKEYERGLVDYHHCVNLMKGAIVTCDRLTTVSPTYARDITEYGGHWLEQIIRENKYKLTGIINGIDTTLYDPAKDTSIFANFSSDSALDMLAGKAENKRRLQALFGLPADSGKLLLCVVSRLVSHKGMDLLTVVADDIVALGAQLLVLGTGDHNYELYFSELALRHPKSVAVNIAYNPELAAKIYAGSDATLMPSKAEPCGLAQMVAARYGTVPIVRATGGLKDTIKDCRAGSGNGFSFVHYNAGELLYTIRKAHDLYMYHPDDWTALMKEAMETDFSWDASAGEYANLYRQLTIDDN